MSIRRGASVLLSTALMITHIFMAWKALVLITGSRTPLAVVTSESMEPGFQRGDILLLWNRPNHIMVGDIALVAFPTRKLPMVHRVLQSYHLPVEVEGEAKKTRQFIRTKGDNCATDDALLYPNDEGLASRANVVGLVRGIIPLMLAATKGF
ncbi:hypothetical protein NLG97_g8323 [Lecanicillium saksenae]|uniref:Uncharacterized protein n=1 Tax=Lecanicillium saksenae TaxID=468837 RepID=A0ACC1QM93_9HYPO|nr:hypothetical protein NLG97_g8323 [Lecanicillium saksenae]